MNSLTQAEFAWTAFYSEFADKLQAYRQNRTGLLALLEDAFSEIGIKYPFDYHGDLLNDIDPFTVFGSFNKGITNQKRSLIMGTIGKLLGVTADVPISFEGIPVLNNMLSWFIRANTDRGNGDVDRLWNLFDAAIALADHPGEGKVETFIRCYDAVTPLPLVKWNITMGLYWIRPLFYMNLDGKNREILLNRDLPFAEAVMKISNLKKPPDAKTYLAILNLFHEKFQAGAYPVSSFPELSQSAWMKTMREKPEGASPEQVRSGAQRGVAQSPRGKHYWIYSPGEGSRLWDEFYEQGIMGIGFGDIGDLNGFVDRESMRAEMRETGDASRSYRNDSLATWQFAHEMQVGDIVFAKKGLFEIVGRGVILSDYIYMPERTEYTHVRTVEWTHRGSWQHPGQAVMKTLTDITQYTDYVQDLEKLVCGSESIDEPDEIIYPPYSKEDFLREVFMDGTQYGMLSYMLYSKKNLVIQGAPGVGKTFAAKRLAYSLLGEKDTSRVMMIQFHQSYSYEDFIMGFRPVKDGFELKDGPFYSFCKRAQDDTERDYFFIIDEINRGNLSKIFGELLMLIENDKRGEQLRLLYANELFSVPKNVYIIGLMNTADRSLALIDYALRRRFAFYEMVPAFDSDGFRVRMEDAENEKFLRLIARVKELNEQIAKDDSLGAGFRIGHSYFCTEEEVTDLWLSAVVEFELLPLLNEYWFDEKSKVEEWTRKLRGALND